MRIDGRFDPKQWVQPQSEEAEVSKNIEKQPLELQLEVTVSEQRESDEDFAGEIQMSYAYTYASRTAATVTGLLEETRDL